MHRLRLNALLRLMRASTWRALKSGERGEARAFQAPSSRVPHARHKEHFKNNRSCKYNEAYLILNTALRLGCKTHSGRRRATHIQFHLETQPRRTRMQYFKGFSLVLGTICAIIAYSFTEARRFLPKNEYNFELKPVCTQHFQ